MQPTRRLQGTAVVISALGDSDAGGCAGFRELKAKAVPDMLSVLSTAASVTNMAPFMPFRVILVIK